MILLQVRLKQALLTLCHICFDEMIKIQVCVHIVFIERKGSKVKR